MSTGTCCEQHQACRPPGPRAVEVLAGRGSSRCNGSWSTSMRSPEAATRLMDSMRVVVNMLGNCVATFVVARSEGQLDVERMQEVLFLGKAPETEEEQEEPVAAELRATPTA